MMRKLTMKRTAALFTAVALGLLGVAAAPASPASAATSPVDLYAVTGSTTLPGGQSVTVWGYSEDGSAVTAPGGPVIEATVGESVQITLHNDLSVDTALLIQGQEVAPDLTGAAPSGSTKVYTFTADHPGTYLYEAGLLGGTQYQTAMGLHGAFVVHPATGAYGLGTEYDVEAPLVLSEIDPALNGSGNPATFDMRNFKPRYTLINGQAHPDVATIDATAGETVLLRYVNAGIEYHSMGILGGNQRVIALDGSPLDFARTYTAETIGPGQTADALVVVPNLPQAEHSVSVYDASLLLHNSNLGGAGGMYTSIAVSGTPAGSDVVGPVTSGVAVTPANLVQADVSDVDRGGNNVTAAEFYVDTVGAAGTPMSMGGSFGSTTVAVSGLLPSLSGMQEHVIYVRGQDADGNWGPFSSVLITAADAGGPTIVSPSLTPSATNHDSSKSGVAISATADDTGSGNSTIWRARYRIDGGAQVDMTVSPDNSAPVASVDATIIQPAVNLLSEGTHVISIQAQDGEGNWGDEVSLPLDIDLTGPATSGVDASPSPNNGTQPFNSSIPAVRVSVQTMVDAGIVQGTVKKAEMFLDTVGADGTGIPLIASDGLFDGLEEGGYADIPLATVKQLPNGPHTIYVHARDAVGNWGPTDSATLLVDKTAPVLSGAALTPNPTAGATQLALALTATDAWTAPTAAEWFIGTDPGAGNGTALSGFAATGTGPYSVSGTVDIGVRSEGNLSVRVRVRDGAGNWSAVTTLVVNVTAPLYYSTVGNTNPPGVGGSADDADIYYYPGTGNTHTRWWDASAHSVPNSANLDGFDRVDDTHFYVSFAPDNTNLGGGLIVQDEDVVYYDNGTWSVYFNGTLNGLTGGGRDIDAINIVGGELYFSTRGNGSIPGVGGTADDADIYKWSGSSFSRVFDASANGLPGNADVDGVVWQDNAHQYFSFVQNSTSVPGLGNVPDEDVVYRSGGDWTRYFDGSAHGLSSNNEDIDAFDLP